jgi:hypothetical protein
MDKMGIVALVVGLVLLAIGGYAIWAFFPEVVIAVKGSIGIFVAFIGLMLVIFGILVVND